MTTKNGGPAFPVPQAYDEQGMTLRDYFAANALPAVYAEFWRGVVAREYRFSEDWRDGLALDTYALADAMLKARKTQ